MDEINRFLQRLNESTKHNSILKRVSAKSGMMSGHIVVILCSFVIGFMMFGIGSHLICDFIGIAYPAYLSFKAIESKEAGDDKQWLTYWVVFAIFRVLDDSALFVFFWIPFYYPLKLLFLAFLFSPQTRGALILYEKLVKPFLMNHQNQIDKGLAVLEQEATKLTGSAKDLASKQGGNYTINNKLK